VEEDNDVAVDEAVSFDVVFGDESVRVRRSLKMSESQTTC
jgi:hypothetical protein